MIERLATQVRLNTHMALATRKGFKMRQTLKGFFSSKTNWTGMSMIAAGGYGLYSKSMEPTEAIMMIGNGFGLIGIKSAIVGSNA